MINQLAKETQNKIMAYLGINKESFSPASYEQSSWYICEAIQQANAPYIEALKNIINSAVHPDKAVRRVMVDLAPIRKVLQDNNL